MKLHTLGEGTSQKSTKAPLKLTDRVSMRYIMALMALIIVSCGQDLTTTRSTRSSTQNFSALTCSCSDQNSPVCAFTGSQYVTFLNGCIAQCNGFTFNSGACTPTTTCNQNSGQVCGQPPMPTCVAGMACTQQMPIPVWFASQCDLMNAKALVVDASNCP